MRVITDEVQDQLTVDDVLKVQGSVSAGATVTDGGHLVVYGNLAGPVVINTGGVASVYGNLAGDLHLRGGLVLVAGNCIADLIERDGHLGVAVGSMFNGSVLESDGSLRPARNDETLDIAAEVASFRILTDHGTFIELPPDLSENPPQN